MKSKFAYLSRLKSQRANGTTSAAAVAVMISHSRNLKRKMKPASINVQASQLAADPKVALRIAALQKPAADAASISLESHLRDLKSLRDQAREAKQFAAAITAEIARGKASGVHVEKSESTITTRELPASVDEFV